MTTTTTDFLAAQRRELLARRESYLADKARSTATALELTEDGANQDMADEDGFGEGDTLNVERDRLLVVASEAQARVAEIDAALGRVDAGTYGLLRGVREADPHARPRGRARGHPLRELQDGRIAPTEVGPAPTSRSASRRSSASSTPDRRAAARGRSHPAAGQGALGEQVEAELNRAQIETGTKVCTTLDRGAGRARAPAARPAGGGRRVLACAWCRPGRIPRPAPTTPAINPAKERVPAAGAGVPGRGPGAAGQRLPRPRRHRRSRPGHRGARPGPAGGCPTVVALPANSPFWAGADTRLRQLPDRGLVPLAADRHARAAGVPGRVRRPGRRAGGRRRASPTPRSSTGTSGPRPGTTRSSSGPPTPASTSTRR